MPGGTTREQVGWGLNPGMWLQTQCLAFITPRHTQLVTFCCGRLSPSFPRPWACFWLLPSPFRGWIWEHGCASRAGPPGAAAALLSALCNQRWARVLGRLWAGRARGSLSFAAILLRASEGSPGVTGHIIPCPLDGSETYQL